MADIFISYARADQAKARDIAGALEGAGHSVWWDRHIHAGATFADAIERELAAAAVVLVCWSASGVRSRWVRDEAAIAAEEGKLVAVSLDGALPPIGFRQFHALSLEHWNGGRRDALLGDLRRAIDAKLEAVGRTAPAPESPTARSNSGMPRLAVVAAFGVAVVAALAALLLLARPASDAAPGTEPAASIAVLPFADLSEGGSQQYFADGISEEILNILSRVEGLRVASRTTSFDFRERAGIGAGEIGRRLNVRHLLDGSIRRAGGMLRVSAHLVDTRSDRELWAQTFDRELTMENLFAIQDEIASGIVSALGEEMGLGHADALKFAAAADTKNLDAYSDYLRGQSLFYSRTAKNYPQMLAAFRSAVEKDPTFGRAWVGLGAVYSVAPTLAPETHRQRDFAASAREAVKRAIALEPELAMTHAVAANVALMEGYTADTMARAMAGFDKAVELDPEDPLTHNWRGQLKAVVGDLAGAREDIEKAIAIDPADTVAHGLLVALHLYENDVAGALKAQRRAGRYLPTISDALALALARRGDRSAMKEVVGLMGGDWQSYSDVIDSLAGGNLAPERARSQMQAILPKLGKDVPTLMTQFRQYMIRDFDSLAVTPDGNFPIYWLRTWPAFLDHPARYRNMIARDLGTYWARHGLPPMCKATVRRPDGRSFECE